MSNITNKIVDSQLRELGVTERRDVPRKEEASRGQADRLARPKSIFDDDYLPRAARRTVAPGGVQTDRKNQWTKDAVCERLEVMARDWKIDEQTASMDARALDAIVTVLATDFANALEHAGLVYRSGLAPAVLADMVSDFITTQTKVRVGGAYYDVGVSNG
jgi:hypothetical protein